MLSPEQIGVKVQDLVIMCFSFCLQQVIVYMVMQRLGDKL